MSLKTFWSKEVALNVLYEKNVNYCSAFIWNKYFCKIINVFTLKYDQFNAPLLNKGINFFEKKKKEYFWSVSHLWSIHNMNWIMGIM